MTDTTTPAGRFRLTGALASEPVTADSAGRTLTGLAVPWGVQGHDTSHGALIADRGALAVPAELRRVKLLRDHDRTAPVGYLTGATDTPDGLLLTFRVSATPAGDAALADAAEGLRDGLSVEVDDPVIRAGHLTGGRLVAVAQCAIPAWDDARLTLTAMAAPVSWAEDDDGGPPTLTDLPPITADLGDPAMTDDDTTATVPAESGTVTGALAPARTRPRPAAPLTFRGAMDTLARYGRQEIDANTVRAALADIVPANDAGEGLLRPAWLGELWSATYATRPLIDSVTSKQLPATGTKVFGWGWTTRPTGGPYTGNKTDVPSGPAATGPLEAPVRRWAGANDIDRIYVDRGDPGFRAAYYEALSADYALDTEAELSAALVAAATDGGTATGLPDALVQAGQDLAAIGATLSWVACAPDVYTGAFAITSQEAPWLLGGASADIRGVGVSIGGIRVFSNASLPAATVLAGDRRAATYWEEAPPIRVETVNIPQGGVDWGLFGYYAYLVNDPRALLSYDTTVVVP